MLTVGFYVNRNKKGSFFCETIFCRVSHEHCLLYDQIWLICHLIGFNTFLFGIYNLEITYSDDVILNTIWNISKK